MVAYDRRIAVEFANTTRRDNLRTFPEFDSPSWPAAFVHDRAQVRAWAAAAAATGNVVCPLGVPHQIATEQDE